MRGGFEPAESLPRFTVLNRRSEHVFVKLEDLSDGSDHIFFVRRQSEVQIDSIPTGTYEVSFAVDGRLGGDCTQLVAAKSISRFDEPFEFYRRTKTHADGYEETEIGDNWIELGGDRDHGDSSPVTLDRFNS